MSACGLSAVVMLTRQGLGLRVPATTTAATTTTTSLADEDVCPAFTQRYDQKIPVCSFALKEQDL